MKNLNRLFLVLALFLQSSAFAQNAWEKLFIGTFHNSNIYEESKCTFNVLRFFQTARKMGLDTTQAEAIEIVNKGLGNIGFVTGFQCRSESPLDTKNNWYHHVIIKVGNTILDYDYLNTPTPTPIKQYFRNMFMNDKMKKDLVYCLKEIGKYEITVYSGKMFLKYYEERVTSDQISRKRAFLETLGWACVP